MVRHTLYLYLYGVYATVIVSNQPNLFYSHIVHFHLFLFVSAEYTSRCVNQCLHLTHNLINKLILSIFAFTQKFVIREISCYYDFILKKNLFQHNRQRNQSSSQPPYIHIGFLKRWLFLSISDVNNIIHLTKKALHTNLNFTR